MGRCGGMGQRITREATLSHGRLGLSVCLSFIKLSRSHLATNKKKPESYAEGSEGTAYVFSLPFV